MVLMYKTQDRFYKLLLLFKRTFDINFRNHLFDRYLKSALKISSSGFNSISPKENNYRTKPELQGILDTIELYQNSRVS